MKASRLHDDGNPFQLACDQLPPVARHAGFREARDRAVGDPNWVGHLVGEKTKPRTEDDRDSGLELPQPLFDRRGRGLRRALLHYNKMPASVADRKLASVPAIIARKPRRARSCLRSGARAPMPPIWIPTELRLAKPHSANVAIVNDTGSSVAFNGPRCAYAMNSLITIRSPSNAPMVPLSCQGTPITHAIGRKIQPSTV